MIIFSSLIYYTCGLDRKYRVLVCVCMYVCLSVCVCVCVLKVYVLWGKSCIYSALVGSSNLVRQYFANPPRLRSFSDSLTRDSCSQTNLKNTPQEECATFTKHTHVRVRWCVRLCALWKKTHTCKVASPDGYPTRNTLSNQSYFHSASTLNKLLGIFKSA